MRQRFARGTGMLLVAVFSLPLVSGCFLFPQRVATPGVAQGGTASLRGVVRYMTNQEPVVGAKVSLFDGKVVAVTDAQGNFAFPSVHTGWQTVYVRKDSFLVSSEAVRLNSGQSASLSFLLQPTEGHLHGASSRVPNLCGSCHVLHQQPLMVGGSANYPCFGCHKDTYPRFSNEAVYRQTLHSADQPADSPSPVTLHLTNRNRGDCGNCHEPHGINNSHRHLLMIASPTSSNPLCYTCHKDPGSGHTKDYPGQTACEATDNPHLNPASTRPDLLTLYPGSEADVGECYNCHNPHGATRDGSQGGALTDAMTRDQEEKLCVKCHTYMTGQMAQGTKHACSLCHNPHQVKKAGVRQVKAPGKAGLEPTTNGQLVNVTNYYGTHRLVSNQLTNDYCLGCHNSNADNPYRGRAKVPDSTNTSFKNITTGALPNANYRDLHKVHVYGPIGDDDGSVTVGSFQAGGGTNNRRTMFASCYPGGYHEGKGSVPKTPENKVWCIQCHDVHPSLPTAGNQRGRLLRTNLIQTAKVTSNLNGTGYDGKGSCSMNTAIAPCHAGHDRNNKYTGCDWCHAANGGSPGYVCDCVDKTCGPYYNGGGDWGGGSGGTDGFAHGSSHYDARTTNRRPVML